MAALVFTVTCGVRAADEAEDLQALKKKVEELQKSLSPQKAPVAPAVPVAAAELDAAVLAKVKAATVLLRFDHRFNAGTGKGSTTAFFVRPGVVVTWAGNLDIRGGAVPFNEITATFHETHGNERSEKATVLACDAGFVFLKIDGANLPEPLSFAPGNATTPAHLVEFERGKANPGLIADNPALIVRATKAMIGEALTIVTSSREPQFGPLGGPIVNSAGEVVAIAGYTTTSETSGCPGDAILRILCGHVTKASIVETRSEGGRHWLDIRVALFDPLKSVKSVDACVWVNHGSAVRPINENKLKMYGAPGDGPLRKFALQRGQAPGLWRAETSEGLEIPEGDKLWMQASWSSQEIPESLGGAAEVDIAYRFPHVMPGEERSDGQGNRYVLVKSAARRFKLPDALQHLVSAADGRHLFAIASRKPAINVLDPVTFDELERLDLPGPAESLWCDSKSLVAVCRDAKKVVFFDPQTHACKRTVDMTLRDPECFPVRVLGRAADGAVMVLSLNPNASSSTVSRGPLPTDMRPTITHVSEGGGAPTVILTKDMEWGTYANGGQWVLAQGGYAPTPLTVYDVRTGNILKVQFAKSDDKGLPFEFGEFARCLLSDDRTCLFLPRRRREDSDWEIGGPWTYAFSPNLSQCIGEFPGAIISEVPAQNLLVSWGEPYLRKTFTSGTAEINYVDRKTFKVMRKILITNYQPQNGTANQFTTTLAAELTSVTRLRADHGTVYVPGYELLVEMYSPFVGNDFVDVIPCGPVRDSKVLPIAITPPAAAPATPPASAQADAPAQAQSPAVPAQRSPVPETATVGKKLVYRPYFVIDSKAKKTIFRLKEGPKDMVVDSQTGEFTWTPTAESIGDVTISIVADVDGNENHVLFCTINVKK
jgi:hypothetical protein